MNEHIVWRSDSRDLFQQTSGFLQIDEDELLWQGFTSRHNRRVRLLKAGSGLLEQVDVTNVGDGGRVSGHAEPEFLVNLANQVVDSVARQRRHTNPIAESS